MIKAKSRSCYGEQPKSPQNRVCLKPGTGIGWKKNPRRTPNDSEVLIQFSDKG